jgi:hypothetical protein
LDFRRQRSNSKARASQCARNTALRIRLSFHRLAERELNDATLYYERENPELGVRFLQEIERLIDVLRKSECRQEGPGKLQF